MCTITAVASKTASRKIGEAPSLSRSSHRGCSSMSATVAAGWRVYSTAFNAAGTIAALSKPSYMHHKANYMMVLTTRTIA